MHFQRAVMLIKGVFEEVEKISDADELREIVKRLIKENLILSRRTNIALKSLENQNTLIKCLQQTLVSMMARNVKQASQLCAVLGSEMLRKFEDILRYQLLLTECTNHCQNEETEKKVLNELATVAYSVPYDFVRNAQSKCLAFLQKYSNDKRNLAIQQIQRMPETVQKARPRPSKYQNGRINTFIKNRKDVAKNNRSAYTSSQKHSLEKSKSESSGRRNYKHSRLAFLGETSQSDMEDDAPCKFPRRRRFKRKAGEMNDEQHLNKDNGSSTSANVASPETSQPNKKLRDTNNDSILDSVEEAVNIKPLFIELTDFMTDPVADNDPCIAQYKQTYIYKDNAENESEIVDDSLDNAIGPDEKIESDHNSNDESDIKEQMETTAKSPEPENNNQIQVTVLTLSEKEYDVQSKQPAVLPKSTRSQKDDTTSKQTTALAKSTVSQEDNDVQTSNIPILNGKKGPCTPPPLPPPPDDSIFIRGPRTPPYSPPAHRRGPCTPPGAPSSESEATDDEDTSGSSTTTAA